MSNHCCTLETNISYANDNLKIKKKKFLKKKERYKTATQKWRVKYNKIAKY